MESELISSDMVDSKPLTKLLRVNFTAKEKLDIGDQMACAVRNIKQAEDDLASVSSQFKSDIKKFQAELTGFAEKLNSGWEMRQVNCVQIKDYQLKVYQIKRLDTLETVEERALTVEELQMGLFEKKEEGKVFDAEFHTETPPAEEGETEEEEETDGKTKAAGE